MIQSIETTGKTTEDALKAALAELGLTRDEVSVEIVTMPKSGFFGIGALPAKLRFSFDDGRPEPQAVPESEKKPAAEKKPAPARNPASEKKPAAAKAPKAKAPAAAPARAPESAPRPAGSREEEAETFLRGLLERMGVECTIAIAPREGGGMDITLDGENMGAVIGRKGETLDAIQHLVNFTVNRKVVFNGNESFGKALIKYAALAVVVLGLNLALMHLLTGLGWSIPLAKIVVEVLLFCMNFVVQGRFVYRKGGGKGKAA